MTEAEQKEFAHVKAKAEAFYTSVMKVRCPAILDDIHFSTDGFHHLRFNGSRAERDKKVQKTKMLCLEEAVDILKRTTTIQEYRKLTQPVGKTDSKGFRKTKCVHYYAFHAITNFDKSRRINVVIRKVGEGNYHFWSVMPSWKEEKINNSQTTRFIGGGWMIDT